MQIALVVKLGVDHYGNRSIAKVGENVERRSILFFEIFGIILILSSKIKYVNQIQKYANNTTK
jgi:hypothetical protein